VKIFNWVRNNIEFVPTWGSIQGAELCLETRAGNAFDTASLLITLLRYSGIPARYQMGTIEVPIEKFMNWAGGFTNAEAAASLFASGGVPSVVRRVDQGGNVVSVKLEHVWVKALVDYTPSGGAVNIRGDSWIEIDPSFKQHNIRSPAIDLTAARPFNRDEYLASSTSESPAAFYRQTLINFVQQNHPGKTLDDFLSDKSIRVFQPSLLGGSLPYRVLVRPPGLSDIPANLRQQVTIDVALPDSPGSSLSYTAFLVQLLGKRISLSFMPASASDIQTATAFQGIYFVPPYLLSVKPVLRVAGLEAVSGSPTGMGKPLSMTIRIRLADGAERIVQNEITAGAYSTTLLAPHIITEGIANALGKELDAGVFDNGFGRLNIDNSDRDAWVAGGLQGLGTYYFNRLDEANRLLNDLYPIGQFKTAFQATVSADVEVSSLFGTPRGLQVKGVSIDADLLEDIAVSKNGGAEAVTAFEKLRGLESSYWEHATLEASGVTPDIPSVSTVRALQEAIARGVQVLKINGGNLAASEPLLQVPEKDKEAVRDAVNAGLEVTIPANSLQLGSWRGVGYIIEDPRTGAGAYQISGGLSGSVIAKTWPGLAPSAPSAPVANRPTAVLAVGITACNSLRCSLGYRWVNDFEVADSIGGTIHSYGYNVYVAAVSAASLTTFVDGTGVQTPDDVLYFIGHGFSGQLVLRASQTDERNVGVGPGIGSRKFKLVLLTACATGGLCPPNIPAEQYLTGNFNCTPRSGLQDSWGNSLLIPVSGSALVGYSNVVEIVASNVEAKLFWSLIISVPVGDLAGSTNSAGGAYLRGDPTATLRVFP
jgi:hypothetical protein